MENDIAKILISEDEIQAKIDELGIILSEEYKDKNPVIIGVLRGVVVFFSDMIRKINVPCQIDFMYVSSYKGTNSTGQMVVKKDISEDIKGRHVLILEDIFDTGRALDFTYQYLLSKEPASLKCCTLLDKPARRASHVKIHPDYVGFTIPNEFVVGYGLDYNEYYRNLPYVGILKPEVYNK